MTAPSLSDPVDLGWLRETESPRFVTRWLVLLLHAVLAAGCGGAIVFLVVTLADHYHYAWATDATSLVILTLFDLVCAALFVGVGWFAVQAIVRWWPTPTVSLYQNGVVCEQGGARTIIAWDEIDRVVFRSLRITLVTIAGDKTNERHFVRIGAGPESIVLAESLRLTPTVLHEARRASLANVLPLGRLHASETVTFGAESVSHAEVRLGGRGIPWSRVRRVEMERGLVIATASGRPKRASQWVRKIPNADVFVALCEAVQNAGR